MNSHARAPGLLRGAMSLGTGSAVAQALMLAGTPILTRIYTPEAYGGLGIVATISTLFFVGASGRYDLAIVLPRRAATARLLLDLSLTLITCTTLITALVVVLLNQAIARAFGNPSLASLLWWLPLSVGAMGTYEALSSWLVRHTQYGHMAGGRITRSSATIAGQALFGWAGLGGTGLVAGQSIGQLSAAMYLWRAARRTSGTYTRAKRTFHRIRVLTHRYRDFPRFSVPQAILDAGSQQLPVFILGATFGPGPVGLFWFTNRLLQLATELFGYSVRQVFHQQVAQLVRERMPVGPLFRRVTAGLVSVSALPSLLLMVFGPLLFSRLFGPEWLEAGAYARWLALSWLGSMATQPSIALVFTLELQRGQLVWEGLLLVARILGMLVGLEIAGAMGVVAGFATATAAAGVVLFLWVARVAEASDRSVSVRNDGA